MTSSSNCYLKSATHRKNEASYLVLQKLLWKLFSRTSKILLHTQSRWNITARVHYTFYNFTAVEVGKSNLAPIISCTNSSTPKNKKTKKEKKKNQNSWSLLGIATEIFCKISRSSHPEVFHKKDVLRNFTKFTGKHLCQSLFIYFLYHPWGFSSSKLRQKSSLKGGVNCSN